jgi:S1-C subfamily serine protease
VVLDTLTTFGIEVSAALADLAATVNASVVQVSDGHGGGAGTIWSSDGLVVTNHHVVPGEKARVITATGTSYDGRVVANLPDRDLALLQVDAEGLAALPAGDSARLRVGELVMAVGHPFGVTGAASLGVFSGIGPIEQRRGRHFREAVLANIELRPGNSGGPLVNMRGEVVGINSMVLGHGTALAVPSNVVTRLIGAQRRRTLGIQAGVIPAPAEWVERFGLMQDALLIVLEVLPGGSAARAGLLPGDVLLSLHGQSLEEPGDIAWVLAGVAPGSPVPLRILRGGELLDLAVATDE